MMEISPETAGLPAQIASLQRMLAEERAHYEAMLEVAGRQERAMAGNDPDAVERTAAEMASGLEAAEAVRGRRERLAEDLMSRQGAGAQRLSAWLARQPVAIRDRLTASVQGVREAATLLAVANEKNRRLASFCLDLVEEEAHVLRRALLQDPAGRYDRGARPTNDGGGRVVQKQA